MIQAKKELLEALGAALVQVEPLAPPAPAFESPKHASHGDLACTAAMALGALAEEEPARGRDAARRCAEASAAVQRWVDALEIAGPGFINLRLKDSVKQATVGEVLAAGERFGRQPARSDQEPQRVLVEFVSANPTGPLHVGHARQAALGDAICNLFETQGWQVTREFYYNDAGVQIATLAASCRRGCAA